MDREIRSRARTTAGRLAKALECSERTIRADLNFLRDRFGAPLLFEQSKGWHYTTEDWRLPSVPISQGELFALTLGAKMLSAYGGSAYESELRSAIARLADRLPEQTWVNLQQLAQEGVLVRPGASLNLDPDIWHTLERACREQRRVKMRYYTARRNQESWRSLDPYLLHFSRSNPYVTGLCHATQEIRWFRVDRIRELTLMQRRFKVRSDFDPQQHFAQVFQHEVGGEPRRIRIWFDASTAPYVRERQWCPDQQIEEQGDGSMILQFEARGLNEVKRWILFYGQGAIAREPPELVAMVREEIRAMQTLYEVDQ